MPEHSPPEPGESQPDSSGPRGSEFIFYAALFEGALILLALVLAAFGLYDPNQPLTRLSWQQQLLPGLIWGGLGTLPLLILLLGFEHLSFWPFNSLARVTELQIRPLFAGTALHELFLVALLAGLGEELLFRWAIQGGLAAWFDSPSGQVLAVVIAAVLFGLCHFLNLAYAAVTFVIGIYFGGLMSWSGTWLAPAIAHAAYDFLALIYLTRWSR